MPISIGNQVAEYEITSTDLHFLAQSDSIITPDGNSIEGILNDDQFGAQIVVAGTVLAGNVGVRANNLGDNTQVTVTSTGVVVGSRFGIAANTGNDNSTIINYGTVSGYEQAGIASFGDSTAIINTGSVYGQSQGVRFATGATNGTLNNSGLITGGLGVLVSGDDVTITNSGTILADGSQGASGYGISSDGGALDVTNTGLIDGEGAAIDGGTEQDYISNSGTLAGDVFLADNDDTYIGTANGVVTGLLDLGSGEDFAQLGDVGGVVEGGTGDDTIRGGAGSDELYGGNDNDDIRGRTGDDTIEGGSGNDTLRAGQGDDEVFGGTGDDFIRAGAGDDIVVGGTGLDEVFGGTGADTFVFTAITDSPDDNALRDVYQDFVSGEDVFDLTAFAGLSFIGDDAFSGTGAEIRVTEVNAIGRVKVFVDTDGDGTADMKFILNNTTNLTEDDFLF